MSVTVVGVNGAWSHYNGNNDDDDGGDSRDANVGVV